MNILCITPIELDKAKRKEILTFNIVDNLAPACPDDIFPTLDNPKL